MTLRRNRITPPRSARHRARCPGVSSFQIQIADYDILTAGDRPDVLVAMNPAALKANVVRPAARRPDHRQLRRVHQAQPRQGRLRGQPAGERRAVRLRRAARRDDHADARRRRAHRRHEEGRPARQEHVRARAAVVDVRPRTRAQRGVHPREVRPQARGRRGQRAGAEGGLELRRDHRGVRHHLRGGAGEAEVRRVPADLGQHRAGLRPGGRRPARPTSRSCSAPTRSRPASDILHELSKYKHFNVLTFQAEDEIAGIGAAIGASYGGALGVTSTSGPGISLKSEAIGLAVMTELPLIVIDVQRGGPSTGLPTKTEQADLLQVLYGRNGESPVAVLAPRSPSDCFDVAVEAVRIAVNYHTPVVILSDGAIANGSEPWRIPDVSTYAPIDHTFAEDRRTVPAVRPRPRNPGPPVRRPGNARSRAPDRRPRGRQRFGQHLLRAEEPRPDGPVAPGQDRRHHGARPRGRRSHRRRRTAAARLGQLRTARSARRAGAPGARASRSPTRTCATSIRSRPTSVTC